MALQTIPGFTGLTYARVSSLDGRAMGKLTDTNHLESLQHDMSPFPYDKKIIDIYTQSSLYSNDFLDMINKSTLFYLGGLTDTWKWQIEVPYQFPKIIDIPASTLALTSPGIDGKSFEIVLDTKVAKNSVISVGHKMYGQNFGIISDPYPYDSGWLHTCVLISANPTSEYVNPILLQQGIDVEVID